MRAAGGQFQRVVYYDKFRYFAGAVEAEEQAIVSMNMSHSTAESTYAAMSEACSEARLVVRHEMQPATQSVLCVHFQIALKMEEVLKERLLEPLVPPGLLKEQEVLGPVPPFPEEPLQQWAVVSTRLLTCSLS